MRAFQEGVPEEAWMKNRDVFNHPFLEEEACEKAASEAPSQKVVVNESMVSAFTKQIETMVQRAPIAVRDQMRTESLAFGQTVEKMLLTFLERMTILCQGPAPVEIDQGAVEQNSAPVAETLPISRSTGDDSSIPGTGSSRQQEEWDSPPRKIKTIPRTVSAMASKPCSEATPGTILVTNGFAVLQQGGAEATLLMKKEIEEPLPPGTHV
jgi:transcription elongation GreA/GreB family factor